MSTATPPPTGAQTRRGGAGARVLMLGALGVVFGDIGTSGLYALQTVFASDGSRIGPTPVDVYGILSLVFWTLIIVVSVEFVLLIMRADNDGEGGIMALMALVRRIAMGRPWVVPALMTAGLLGVALFFGDGMITPAISVLSAVEGLEVVDARLASWVVPITLVVLTGLFATQRFGTGSIGRVFGPVMLVWFVILAIAGIAQVAKDPAILQAALPTYALEFLTRHPAISFIALGSVVLTITGTEALYADMGHFGRPAITRAWFWVVFPALLLNYAGQGSLILQDPKAVANPFFLLYPQWAQLPMVLLATVATVIASQAVISGAFSVTNQAVRAGYLPRMRIIHTSNTEFGQVYVPFVNWALFAAVVGLVVVFQSSSALANAYGIAVTGTLMIDTILFLVIMRMMWKRSRWVVALAGIVFLSVNIAFFAANLTKLFSGGWFPVLVAAVMFMILSTWYRGQSRVTAQRSAEEGRLSDFLEQLKGESELSTIPGTSVHLSLTGDTTPLAMRVGAARLHTLTEQIIILTLRPQSTPHVPDDERLSLQWMSDSPVRIGVLTARLGFRDEINAPALMALARDQGLIPDLNVDSLVYLMSHITVKPDTSSGMATWRKRLFRAMARNSSSPTEYFGLPPDRTISIGTEVGV